MLINVGLRTDIAAYYSDWLFRRFGEGYAYSRNPLFPKRVSVYDLSPGKVDAVLFCSKNYAPVLSRLPAFLARYKTLFHFTLNGYGADLEPAVPAIEERLETLAALAKIAGRERIFWRYDPILINGRYSADWHAETYAALAEKIAPYAAGCIVNFAELSSKIRGATGALPLSYEEKSKLIGRLQTAASRFSLPFRVCAMEYSGEFAGGCTTLSDIATANGCGFRETKHLGNRRNCLCITSRDLGWYNSCPARCAYCNANRDDKLLAENLAAHDPASPLLIGSPQAGDILIKAAQETVLEPIKQISLFDEK